MNNKPSGKSQARKVWKMLRWILGVWLIMGAFGGLLKGEIWQALIVLIIGLALLPIKYINKQTNQNKNNEKPDDEYTALNRKKLPSKNGAQKQPTLSPISNQSQEEQKRTSQLLQSVTTNKDSLPKTVGAIKPVILPTISSSENSADASIIDVTGQEQKLPSSGVVSIHPPAEVVPWPHKYIYSYEELHNASLEQKAFYVHFKSAFHQKDYLDLEGYNNYAFILLFDLLRSYDAATREVARLEIERELQTLGEHYPKTYNYVKSFLVERMSANGDTAGMQRIGGVQSPVYYNTNYDYDWGIGKQYAKKLDLSKEQITLLNSINYSKGNFCDIDACFIEVLKLFNLVVAMLDAKPADEGPSLSEVIDDLADIAARKNQHYTKGSANYKWFTGYHKVQLYEHIMKHCDNAVREAYQYTRTKNTQCTYTSKEAVAAFNSKLDAPVIAAVQSLKANIKLPGKRTEIELNALSTTRWKSAFEAITSSLTKANTISCQERVEHLATLNTKNPSIENIYYEAAKVFAPVSRESAVAFYLKYISADMKSARINAKPLTKTALKNLFKNPIEEAEFEQIIVTLRTSDNLEDALQKAAAIFEQKRKKIQLDTQVVAQVKNQHSGTVEILNEVLNDEDELAIVASAAEPSKVQMESTPELDTPLIAQPKSELSLDAVQQELIAMFAANDFLLSEDSLTTFAKTKALFKSRLIDSLNEQCYELLDDVLVEECEEGYQLNPDYYHKLSS